MLRARLPFLLLSLLLVGPAIATAGCAAPEADDVDIADGATTESELQVEKVAVAGPVDAADKYLLDVTVGKISAERFNALHTRFATARTPAYDATRSYKLVDFLPAFAQKTHGKVLVPHSTAVERSLLDAMERQGMANDGKAYVDGNCHSVTWQWVNHMQKRGGDDAVLTLADGEQLFSETEGFQNVREAELEAGDIYFAKGTGGLEQVDAILHSGVYLGDGLVFEKANPGEAFPYRIAYLADVVAKYKRVDANVQLIYRRISASPVLPTLAQRISIAADNGMLGLTGVDERTMAKYQAQETFDWDTQSSVFTLGWLMPTATAGTDKFYSYGRR